MNVRRILVALDASPGSLAAAEASARLAARLRAELVGLFVEDDRLLRISGAPLAREVDSLTASRRRPQEHDARRGLRLQGERARRDLERLASREGVSWSFRVSRGTVSTEIVNAVEESDIVGLGPQGWSLPPQKALGRLASALLAKRRGCTLLTRSSIDIRPPVVAVYDGSDAANRALALAVKLAAGENQPPVRALLAGVGAEEFAATADELPPGSVAVVETGEGNEADLASALATEAPGTLVLPLDRAVGEGETLAQILEGLDCPVLVVS